MNKEILGILKKRFESNMNRHIDLLWIDIEEAIISSKNIDVLIKMEESGGQPDVVLFENNKYVFFDCSQETPVSRVNLCYDDQALESRKKFKPVSSAVTVADEIGVKLLNESDYKFLQTLGDFDLKTSSWLKTPDDIRKLGGAIFGDKRYRTTFIYHNGAESYYSSRGFRGKIEI